MRYESRYVTLEHQDNVGILTINNAEKRNSISDEETIVAFEEICALVNQGRYLRALIITGAGDSFSSGGDLNKIRSRSMEPPLDVADSYRHGIQRIPRALHSLEIPSIAAVNGPAVGAGCDLACACDMRIASETSWFAESFVKLGIVAGDGGAWLLLRTVGYAKACEMAFTGDRVSAQEALRIGLVNSVVPQADVMGAARDLALRIAKNPPAAVRMTKQLIRESRLASLSTILEMSAALQAIAHTTADHAEAMNAVQEKRPPQFTGG